MPKRINRITLLVSAYVNVLDISGEQLVLVVHELDAGEMGRRKNLSDFDKGQIEYLPMWSEEGQTRGPVTAPSELEQFGRMRGPMAY